MWKFEYENSNSSYFGVLGLWVIFIFLYMSVFFKCFIIGIYFEDVGRKYIYKRIDSKLY